MLSSHGLWNCGICTLPAGFSLDFLTNKTIRPIETPAKIRMPAPIKINERFESSDEEEEEWFLDCPSRLIAAAAFVVVRSLVSVTNTVFSTIMVSVGGSVTRTVFSTTTVSFGGSVTRTVFSTITVCFGACVCAGAGVVS